MGCFSGSCAISHFGIAEDEKCLKLNTKERYGTYFLLQELGERRRTLRLQYEYTKKFGEQSNINESTKKFFDHTPFSYVGYGKYDDYGRVYDVDFEIGEDEDHNDYYLFIKDEAIETILGRGLTRGTFYDDVYRIVLWCEKNRIQLYNTSLLGNQFVGDDSPEKRQQYIDMQQRMLDQWKMKYV